MNQRKLDAYRKRLAKITRPTQLNAECIGAVITFDGTYGGEVIGTLIGYTHRLRNGLMGVTMATEIRICPSCAHTTGTDCVPLDECPTYEVWGNVILVRNGDGEPQKGTKA